MNYNEIGQRIRKYRKERSLSQEHLAEAVNISVTHMSHIETGNTKLSLPVLVALADALQVSCDDLLRGNNDHIGEAINGIMRTVRECTLPQLKIIAALVRAVKENTN